MEVNLFSATELGATCFLSGLGHRSKARKNIISAIWKSFMMENRHLWGFGCMMW